MIAINGLLPYVYPDTQPNFASAAAKFFGVEWPNANEDEVEFIGREHANLAASRATLALDCYCMLSRHANLLNTAPARFFDDGSALFRNIFAVWDTASGKVMITSLLTCRLSYSSLSDSFGSFKSVLILRNA